MLDPVFEVGNQLTGSTTLKNVEVYNSYVTSSSGIVYIYGDPSSSVICEGVSFENVHMESDVGGLIFSPSPVMTIRDVTANNVHPIQANDVSNFLIGHYVNSFILDSESEQIIENVHIEYSSLSAFSFTNPDYTDTVNKNLTVSNVTYLHSVFEYPHTLVTISQLSSAAAYPIVFNDFHFQNLTFDRGGKLMFLRQQIPEQMLIQNILVRDIMNAGIYIETFDSNTNHNHTEVKFQNFTAFNVFGNTQSLMNLNTRANVEISDSVFYHICNIYQGAVLFAGYQKAQVLISNTEFYENTAIEGGVFASESESIVI
jgi:hypothetical protein